MPSAIGGIQAAKPSADVLERVEGHKPRLASWLGIDHAIAQQGAVVTLGDPEAAHASAHEAVLAAAVYSVLAPLLPMLVGRHRLPGEDFQRSEHGDVGSRGGVSEEGALACRDVVEMLFQPVDKKDRVWIDLDDEVMMQVPAVLSDQVPRAQEGRSVHDRAPPSHLGSHIADLRRLDSWTDPHLVVAVGLVLITQKDPLRPLELLPHQPRLIGFLLQHQPAKERRILVSGGDCGHRCRGHRDRRGRGPGCGGVGHR
mmetsp:Transcript_47708/g.102225  ORF Transcript_47708/g.102225 Transcript_47708/m.102225 type:complete len:256 (+) Transcript_47708:90-857(+)